MTHHDAVFDPDAVLPASPQMAEKLAANRTGRLASSQRRLVRVAGVGALTVLMCPVALLVQMVALVAAGAVPAVTVGWVLFTVIGVLFVLLFAAMIYANVQLFLPDAFGAHPVRYAHGTLELRATEGHRPELPFSYIVADYSFGPFVVPPDVKMRPGAPYIVYYAARSRLLLSIAALDAPDADQWQPQFEQREA
jgi:hypothetical protein